MQIIRKCSLPFFLIVFVLIGEVGVAQKWLKPTTNKSQDINRNNLQEIQKEFYDYWAPFKVENGKYINEKGELIKASGYKQFKRWEWYMESHVNYQTGAFPLNPIVTRENNNQNIIQGVQGIEEEAVTYDNWSSLGPNSSGGGYAGVGRINTIAFHPTDNNTYWVGTPAGGLWKTADNGASWVALTDNLASIGVSSIIIPTDYATSNTIYISTGDRDAVDTRSTGVMKSVDGGSTWSSTGLIFTVSSNSMVTQMLLNPSNNNHIIAATSAGLKQTLDAGVTWTALGATDQTLKYIEAKTDNFNTLFAVSKSNFYKSVDAGVTWVKKHTMPSNNSRLTISANDANRIYVINAASELKKVYKSVDAGETLVEVLDGATLNLLGYNADGKDTGGQGWYDLTIEASPTDANVLFVGGVNTWKSVDAGATWTISNHWVGNSSQEVHADKHELVYRKDGTLFEANDGGLYWSTDIGVTYTNNSNGIVNSQMYKIDVDNTDQVIAGLQDNGTKSLSGTTWKDVMGGDGMECIIDFTDSKIQYGAIQNGTTIRRTINSWASSTEISDNIGDGTLKGEWVTPYLMDPNDHKTLFVGYAEIWKSTDMGDSFTQISTFGGNNMKEMAIAQSGSNTMYVYNDSFYATIDGGTTWTNLTANLPDANLVTDIEVDFKDSKRLWLTFGSYSANRIYESKDGGITWTSISSGLPSIPVLAIVQRDLETVEHLYAGTDLGVYHKSGSQPWALYSKSLPNVPVYDLDIRYDNATTNNSKLIAATYGRGIWISPLVPDLGAPTALSLSAVSIAENNSIDAIFGTFSTVDPTEGDTHTYSFVSGENDNASFSIVGNTLKVGSALNFETKSSYKVTAKTCDTKGLCFQRDFTLDVTNVNDAPTTLILDNNVVVENNAVDAQIGLLTTSDEDELDTHTYSLVDGFMDNASFKIVNNALNFGISANFETKSSHSIKLKVCDAAGLCFEQEYTIVITDANDTPSSIGLDNVGVLENNALDAQIGVLSTTDDDVGDVHIFSLVDGLLDNASFSIDLDTLMVSVTSDFETKSTYNVMLRVCDALGACYDQEYVINVVDVNEVPTALAIDNVNIAENNLIASQIGLFSTTDQDVSDTHTYSLVSGSNDNSAFEIVGDTLKAKVSFDFETKTSYVIQIMTTDTGGLTFQDAFVITIINEIETSIDVVSTMTFEHTALDWSKTDSVTVNNDGEVDGIVAISNTNPAFTIRPSSLNLNIGETKRFGITFNPTQSERYEDVVTLTLGEFNWEIEMAGQGAIITGVDDAIIDAKEVTVYPNPATDRVTVDLRPFGVSRPDLKFIAPNGSEMLYMKQLEGDEVVINTSSYTSGVYVIHLRVGDEILTKKVILKK